MLDSIFRRLKPADLSAAHPYTNVPLLLASGLGRSGTTVLRNALSAHSRVAANNRESNILRDLCAVAEDSWQRPDRRDNLVVDPPTYWQLFRQMMLHMHWPVESLRPDFEPQCLVTYSGMTPESTLGLQRVFEPAIVCYMVRNGIEVVSSHMNFAAFESRSFKQHCEIWALRADMFRLAAEQSNVMIFRHEWFLDPETASAKLENVFDRLDMELEPACLNVVTEKRFHPTNMSNEPTDDRSALDRRGERWRYWTDEQRDTFVTICGPAMNDMGYSIPWVDA